MDFLTALKHRQAAGLIPVIPDIKCFSPKEGDLLRGRDPVLVARQLEAAGACVLSVVTEEEEFGGSMDLLRDICRSVSVPVLRKDFIRTEEDLVRTKEAGASAILLMYSCLGKGRLEALYSAALRTGLAPFVETHTAQELQWAGELGAQLVGINNRNILELERDDGDVRTSEGLMAFRPDDAFVVVESGLRNGGDVRRAVRAGADAVLVGTAILQAPDPAAMYRAMTRPCDLKVCGLMDTGGIRLCADQYVDVLGFVTEYPVEVPWNLKREEAADLIAFAKNDLFSPASGPSMSEGRGGGSGEAADTQADRSGISDTLTGLSGSGISDAPAGLSASGLTSFTPKTCIVTGGSPEKVVSLARALRPDLVQLHFTETIEETARIAEALREEGIGVIRSVPTDPEQRLWMFGSPDLADIARLLADTPVIGLLIDSRDAGNASGGGGSILERIQPQGRGKDPLAQVRALFPRSFILGDGLTAGNIREAVELFRPDMADVMTGVETAPGKKSENRLSALTDALAGIRQAAPAEDA